MALGKSLTEFPSPENNPCVGHENPTTIVGRGHGKSVKMRLGASELGGFFVSQTENDNQLKSPANKNHSSSNYLTEVLERCSVLLLLLSEESNVFASTIVFGPHIQVGI